MLHRTRKRLVASLVLAMLWTGLAASPSPSSEPQPIALHEAEILIYLLPVANQLRSEGMDVGWELQTADRFNQYTRQDYYVFWVINVKRAGTGSVTIGYYAVNKDSAEICDMDMDRIVTSTEIEGVQKILRRAHKINNAVVKKFPSVCRAH